MNPDLSTLAGLQEAIGEALEAARTLERDLAIQHFDATDDTRARLSEARQHLGWAVGDVEKAREQLPSSVGA